MLDFLYSPPQEGWYYFAARSKTLYFVSWALPPFWSPTIPYYTVKAEYFPFPPKILNIIPLRLTNDLGASATIQVLADLGPIANLSLWPDNGSSLGKSDLLEVAPKLILASKTNNASVAAFPLVLNPLVETDDAEYRAILKNAGGATTSAWARVVVSNSPPKSPHNRCLRK